MFVLLFSPTYIFFILIVQIVEEMNPPDYTPYATKDGSTNMLDLLLEKAGNMPTDNEKYLITIATIVTARESGYDAVKQLYKKHGSIIQLFVETTYLDCVLPDHTALMHAVLLGNINLVKVLVEGFKTTNLDHLTVGSVLKTENLLYPVPFDVWCKGVLSPEACVNSTIFEDSITSLMVAEIYGDVEVRNGTLIST